MECFAMKKIFRLSYKMRTNIKYFIGSIQQYPFKILNNIQVGLNILNNVYKRINKA